MKLSILMPVYNEERWLTPVVERVLNQKVEGIKSVELIIIDDDSKDGTDTIVRELAQKYPKNIKAIFHKENQGKGAALRSGIAEMTGDLCIIQDADMEYDPANYPMLLAPLVKGVADCVYGSRFQGSEPKRVLFYWHYISREEYWGWGI